MAEAVPAVPALPREKGVSTVALALAPALLSAGHSQDFLETSEKRGQCTRADDLCDSAGLPRRSPPLSPRPRRREKAGNSAQTEVGGGSAAVERRGRAPPWEAPKALPHSCECWHWQVLDVLVSAPRPLSQLSLSAPSAPAAVRLLAPRRPRCPPPARPCHGLARSCLSPHQAEPHKKRAARLPHSKLACLSHVAWCFLSFSFCFFFCFAFFFFTSPRRGACSASGLAEQREAVTVFARAP